MKPQELSNAYQAFFLKSEAGQHFMEVLQGMEQTNITKAQDDGDMKALNKSAGNKEVLDHISTVVNSSEQ